VRYTVLAVASWCVWGGSVLCSAISVEQCSAQNRAEERAADTDRAAAPPQIPRERITPQPPYQPPINFRTPPREYETVSVRAWTVLVEKQLIRQDNELAQKALGRLQQQLDELMQVFPKPAQARFSKLTLFLMFGERADGGGRDNGLEYFQKDAPQHYANLDPRMASSILIYSADNYVWLPPRRALMALAHEFSHAYQLEQWPENEPRIYDTWAHAMQQKLYRNVRDEDGTVLEQGYAAMNQLEYFAELSMVYFVGGYYTPFNRDELKSYDAQGYELVRKMWNIDAATPGKKNNKARSTQARTNDE
jgi:hypothetical protein